LTTNIEGKITSMLIDLLKFLSKRKKLWLFPVILAMLALGGLLLATEGSLVAPFVYTIF